MAEAFQVSQADVDALAKAIRDAPQPKALTLGDFCNIWKQAQPILQTLQPLVGSIPGVGPILAGAIATVLTLGNAAAAALCK